MAKSPIVISLMTIGWLIDWLVLFSLTKKYSIEAIVNADRKKKGHKGSKGHLHGPQYFYKILYTIHIHIKDEQINNITRLYE